AFFDNAAGHEHVHEVRLHVPQDPGVVGDQQHPVARLLAEPVDALGDHLERVDVQARVGLVQDRYLGVEQFELEDLVPLLLPAGEALVQVALGEGRVDGQRGHRGAQFLDEVAQLRCLAPDRGDRGTQEVRHRHAGHLDRVLHGQEQAGPGAIVHGHGQHVLAVQRDAAPGDQVLGVTGDRVGQGGLAGAVRAHDGVGLALADGQVHATQDVPVHAGAFFHADVQVADLEGGHYDSFSTATQTSSPSILTG